jgi:hypothetical protein
MVACIIKDYTYKYLTVEERNISIYFIAWNDNPPW